MAAISAADDIPIPVRRALRLIEAHPSVERVTAERIEGNDAIRAIVEIRTELPNAWRAAGVSPSGVRAVEPVTFIFTAGYPLGAPLIRLRADFNRSHPHIQPSRNGGPPEPCLVAGSPREVLRVRGIGGLFEQLVDWLDKAAMAQLIDPEHGWEPVRRDGIDDVIVADPTWLTGLPTREGGCSVFPAWYYAYREATLSTYRIGIPRAAPVPLGPRFAGEWRYAPVGDDGQTGNAHALIAWSGKLPTGRPFVADRYLPETVTTIDELLKRAAELGCREFLEPKLGILQERVSQSKLKEKQPIAVILLARRPFEVIGTTSPIEICPYVVELRGGEALSSGSGKLVRTATHRDEISPELLRRAAGDDGQALRPWTLLGCGSIGSKLAVHLARSGRGPAALIDDGILQPHNFARYATLPSDTKVESFWSIPKAHYLAEALATLKQPTVPHVVDVVARAFDDQSIAPLVARNSFAVVNTTGSASVREALVLPGVTVDRPRVVEACMLGIGSVGLMSVEGPAANPSATDLICEAYRLIHSDPTLRNEVFNTKAEAIAIGQGCAAITMPLSDGRLSSFAAPMSEHIRRLQRDGLPETGEVLVGSLAADGLNQIWHRKDIRPRIVVGDGTDSVVRLSPEVDDTIRREVAARRGSETGGIILGRYLDVANVFHVVGTMPAPPDSKFSRDEFVLGTEGLRPMLEDLIEGSGGALYALGTWHNHLVPSGPSGKDVKTAALLSIRQYFPLLMLIHTPAGYVHFTAEALSGAGSSHSAVVKVAR
ncbi:thiamine biosynthesis protein ThiF [Bradyrhizobium sp. WBOS7]|uniref:Thiamine biosynthesis protein ThiF n=1 Tax=Bradyrhizobium betae TaxID=244734 RepID=A0AAE9SUX8_9BRAD|nr:MULTISPECIES: thiamine biosynthesis protein ThiF [Bradyrhizobium]MDD1572067.1 thiamine biosynthesis protein ThiF [Bradyrhizobium sp. WBOS1]UUO37125.1 thiamine biosynthesis protein ThiF [Bradyrhizobium sp. WBOS01]MDD1528929.1 thiamine biosynthesis protein ThiF [Bradyrhizobium sp. WBOS2]MDD1578294.1 thiamine biosynthesis protein ThiF [Bradyrhizobium sp. WBOS7]MDD1601327.1 thiamine biosynthesis protein ThiF [Bradyrhizobium sp. WBOS16]